MSSGIRRGVIALSIVFGEACLLTSDLSDLSDGARRDGGAPTQDVVVDALPNVEKEASSTTDSGSSDAGPCGAPDLVAYWTFEEGSGNRINDCSPNGLHGLVVGTPTWVTGRRPTSKALKFGPSASTYVQVPSSKLLDVTSSFTVVGWVLFDDDGSNSGLLGKGDQAFDRGYSIERETDGQLGFYMSPDSSTFKVVRSPPADSMATKWIHLATVFNANVAQSIYVNGRLVATDIGYPTVSPSSFAIDIGRGWGRCCELHGQIDDLRFFARALDGSELTALMNE